MGIIRWLKKRHEKKIKDRMIPTKPYWVRWHWITKHAVRRMNERKITKGEVHENLTTKPIHKSKIKWDEKRRPSYQRTSLNKITTTINPFTQKVASVWITHTKKIKHYLNERKRKKK